MFYTSFRNHLGRIIAIGVPWQDASLNEAPCQRATHIIGTSCRSVLAKRILVFLGLWMSLNISLFSQILNGKIHDGLSQTKGIVGVRIEESIYEPTTSYSDEAGQFMIRLPGASNGASLDLIVYKAGYAVINREALKPILPSSSTDTLHVYLCPREKRSQLALQFYEIRIRRNIEVSYERELKPLLEQQDAKAISELYRKKEAAEKMVDSLAARFAKFDPDYATTELTRAMQLNQEGKVEEALALLDLEKIVERIETKKEVMAGLEKNKARYLNTLVIAANKAAEEGRHEEAMHYFEKAIEADSANVENILTYCLFLKEEGEGKRLIPYAQLLLSETEDPKVQKLGNYYCAWGFLQLGEESEAEGYLYALMQKPTEGKMEERLVSAEELFGLWTQLGRVYIRERQLEEAYDAYGQAVKLSYDLFPTRRTQAEDSEDQALYNEDLVALGRLTDLSQSETELREKILALLQD